VQQKKSLRLYTQDIVMDDVRSKPLAKESESENHEGDVHLRRAQAPVLSDGHAAGVHHCAP